MSLMRVQNQKYIRLTVVIQGLGHPFAALVQHALVQIHNLDLDVPAAKLFSRSIQQSERDIARPARDVEAFECAVWAGLL